ARTVRGPVAVTKGCTNGYGEPGRVAVGEQAGRIASLHGADVRPGDRGCAGTPVRCGIPAQVTGGTRADAHPARAAARHRREARAIGCAPEIEAGAAATYWPPSPPSGAWPPSSWCP